jgi:hypothetical protein
MHNVYKHVKLWFGVPFSANSLKGNNQYYQQLLQTHKDYAHQKWRRHGNFKQLQANYIINELQNKTA